jgi:large subunit ribosomal protein L25
MNIKLTATTRNKEVSAKQLRKDGFIPAIVYGEGKPGVNISLLASEFSQVYRKTIGEVAFIDLKVEDHEYRVYIKDKQVHPVSRDVLHVDFMELPKNKAITLDIPIKITGKAPGEEKGGVLEVLLRQLEVTCMYSDVIDDVEIDVSALDLGDTIHISDLQLSDKLDVTLPADTAVVTVRIPREEEEEEELEEAEETEAETEEEAEATEEE